MSSFLDQYEPLDIIGNGSFGIIRKVRRKADGMVFARKELNFERMTERDRKQIVAEVNILKELHNEHIVRYHDRHVDRDAGILYILMEYCGGGDLSTVIKQAAKTHKQIPEDTIWNYFMQILLALHHCHHPNGHGRSGSGGPGGGQGDDLGNGLGSGSKERRAQILHRDLKPDNVFLDENNLVKLGDFGLSKALSQSSFANTYVGTPYYMSPELMQEKAYDSKSDIWSLGCLIYELCALKPPFHEAKTHSELSMCIRNGRIPPLPRGYSQSLSAVIKAMLNLNPAMRPSAAQLLQHERLELSFRVSETDKLLSQVKTHRAAVLAKEREVLQREVSLKEHEHRLQSVLSQKDIEITRLQAHIQQQQQHTQITQEHVIKQAVARREEELRVLIAQHEDEVANAMAKREEEIMEAVRRREAEVCQAWSLREAEIRQEVEVSIKAVQERVEWILRREEDLRVEEDKVDEMREQFEERVRLWEALQKGKVQKAPLEEVKNILEETPIQRRQRHPPTKNPTITTDIQVTPKPSSSSYPVDTNNKNHHLLPAALQTPIMRPNYADTLPSAMKGVVLTATGETLATPSPNELTKLFNQSPRVGLGFTKIFESPESDPGSETEVTKTNLVTRLRVDGGGSGVREERRLSTTSTDSEVEADSPPPSPSARKEKEWRERGKDRTELSDPGSSTSSGSGSSISTIRRSSTAVPGGGAALALTRLRKPSIRSSSQRRPVIKRTASTTAISTSAAPPPSKSGASPSKSKSVPASSSSSSSATGRTAKAVSKQKSSSRLQLPQPAESAAPVPVPSAAKSHPVPISSAAPVYDLADEENLPSPFLKKVDKDGKLFGIVPPPSSSSTSAPASSSSGATGRGRTTAKKRPSTSGGNYLRAMAAVNVVNGKRAASVLGVSPTTVTRGGGEDENEVARPALLSARKAGEEARKALLRT